MSILVIKVRPGTRLERQYCERDLAFVYDFVSKNWSDTLRVDELNETQIVADLITGRGGIDKIVEIVGG